MMLAHLPGLYLEIFSGWGVCVCVCVCVCEARASLPPSLSLYGCTVYVFVLMVHSNYPIRLLNSQCYISYSPATK